MTQRIAHCIHGLGLGGAQKILETIVTSLQRPDLEHYVYCSLDGPVGARLEAAAVPVRVISRHLPKFDPIWVRHLSKSMSIDRINLVHTHLFGDSLHGHLAATTSGRIPTVMTLHSNQTYFSRLQRLGYRWLLPRCSGVVACSASVGASFLRAQPKLRGRLKVIPNGIHVGPHEVLPVEEQQQLRKDLGLEADSLVLLAIGRLVEEKGYATLIQAFAELPAPLRARSQLLFLGQGPLENSLKNSSQDLGLQDQVLFGGYRQDVHTILPLADVVVFSSLSEGLPIALLEAMAKQKCIVATDIEGFRDAVEADREALLAPPAETDGLKTAIQRALMEPELRSELALQARKRFLKDFTASRMVQSYERLYDEILRANHTLNR